MTATFTNFEFLNELGLAIDVELSRPAPAVDPLAALRKAALAARKHLRRLERETDDAQNALHSADDELTPAQDRELARLEDRAGRIEELLGVVDDVVREFKKPL